MKVSDLLTDSNKWLVKEGRNGQGCYCLSEAIIKCYSIDRYKIVNRVCSYIKSQSDLFKNMNTSMMLIINWNDYPGRTFEEVRKLITDLDI